MKLSIFGSISLIFLSLANFTHAAEVKATAAHALIAETANTIVTLAPAIADAAITDDKEDATYFALLKSVLQHEPCVLAPQCKELNCADCMHSVGGLTELLKNNKEEPYAFSRYLHVREQTLKGYRVLYEPSEEVYVFYDTFLQSLLLRSFLKYSIKPEHSLLLIILDYSNDLKEKYNIKHALVIEKKNNRWRIYQSYITLYTLLDWLGTTLKMKDPKSRKQQEIYETYGGGKILTQKQIREFLNYIHTTEQQKGNRYYMKKFTVPANINEILAKRAAANSTAAAGSPAGNATPSDA